LPTSAILENVGVIVKDSYHFASFFGIEVVDSIAIVAINTFLAVSLKISGLCYVEPSVLNLLSLSTQGSIGRSVSTVCQCMGSIRYKILA